MGSDASDSASMASDTSPQQDAFEDGAARILRRLQNEAAGGAADAFTAEQALRTEQDLALAAARQNDPRAQEGAGPSPADQVAPSAEQAVGRAVEYHVRFHQDTASLAEGYLAAKG